MPAPISVLPDAELAVIQYLRGIASVTALLPGTRIYTAIPAKAVYPLVLVQRAGGVPLAWQFIDDASIQVDVVGGTRHLCSQIARTVRAALVGIRNDTVAEATLASASSDVGLQWIPEQVEASTIPFPRFTARYSVILHA